MPRRDLSALKARLQRRHTNRAVVTGSGNIVAGGDLLVIHRDVKPDSRDGGQGLRAGGKIDIGLRSESIARVNPPPAPVDPNASTWARLGYLFRLLLWRAAERLQ